MKTLEPTAASIKKKKENLPKESNFPLLKKKKKKTNLKPSINFHPNQTIDGKYFITLGHKLKRKQDPGKNNE